jgi:[acyl-carrier-protein] S-malonyltransferase
MRKFGVLFPSSGKPDAELNKKNHHAHSCVREIFGRADAALDFPVSRQLLAGEAPAKPGIDLSHVMLYVCGYASFVLLTETMPGAVAAVAGHSVGEYTALAAAQAVSFEEGLRLVQLRARLLMEKKGGLLAVMPISRVRFDAELARQREAGLQVYASNYNALQQQVAAGEAGDVAQLRRIFEQKGYTCYLLDVDTPGHTPLLARQAQVLQQALARATFREPCCPVIANLTGKPYENAQSMAGVLARHLTSPVRWLDTMQYLVQSGVTHLIQASPGNLLTTLAGQSVAPLVLLDFDQAFPAGINRYLHDGIPDAPGLLRNFIGYSVTVPNRNADTAAYNARMPLLYRELQQLSEAPHATDAETLGVQAIRIAREILRLKQADARETKDLLLAAVQESGYYPLLKNYVA